ncbi:MAG: hypothetical protein PHW73_01830 [Atribacterota bacterium]|nr:hypothetical protein [Atribacterota bacterium]
MHYDGEDKFIIKGICDDYREKIGDTTYYSIDKVFTEFCKYNHGNEIKITLEKGMK